MEISKNIKIILILSAFLVVAMIVALKVGLFSVTYTMPDGSRLSCDTYYDGYFYDYTAMAKYCEARDYECTLDSRQGSMGTIKSISCEYVEPPMIQCFRCEDDGSIDISWFTDYETCPGTWESNKNLDCPVDEVKCYKCNSEGTYDTNTFINSCDSGWSLTIPDCHVDVECFACDENGEIESRDFVDECDDGWYINSPSQCDIDIVCYQCSNGIKISDTFKNSCPDTWLIEPPETCQVMIDCYQCSTQDPGTIETMDFPKECPDEWSETEEELNCNSNWFSDLIDFKNEPIQSTLLVLSFFVILGGIVSMIMNVGKKK